MSFFIVAITFTGYLCSGIPASSSSSAHAEPMRCGCTGCSDPCRIGRSAGGRLMFSGFMANAWEIGTIVAVVGGVVGFFVVLRGAAFEAHAIPNGAFAGAAGASLIGASPLLGLGVFAVGAALVIAFLSRRGRPDVVTALALVMMLALGAAFLSQTTQYEPEIFSLLFGEILGVSSGEILPIATLGLASLIAIGVLYRPLLLTSVVPEIADATSVPTFRIELLFLLIVALATTMTVPVVGALLIFSLMIGPPAAARCIARQACLGPCRISDNRARYDLVSHRGCICDRLARGLLCWGFRCGMVRHRAHLRRHLRAKVDLGDPIGWKVEANDGIEELAARRAREPLAWADVPVGE